MKEFLAGVVIFVGVIALILGLGIVFNWFSFQQYSYYAPKKVEVQNKVFHESQPYNEGMVRDLENIKMQYVSATPEQKTALRALVLHRFSVYDQSRLPPDLQTFYNQLSSGVQP